MQKILLLGFLVVLLASSLIAQRTRYVTVIAENANLRGTPSASGRVLGVVEEGETFRLIENRGAWYLVETPQYVGWLHGNTIRLGIGSGDKVSEPRPSPTRPKSPRSTSPPTRTISVPRVETTRPSSGTVMASGSYRTGLGELTISNGTPTDAIAKLIDLSARASYREVYVQANSSTTISNIAVGRYELLFSLGRDYAPSLNKFLTGASYSKFESVITFEEVKERSGNTITTNYDSYRLTLNKVVGGNAPTSRISEAEFTKY